MSARDDYQFPYLPIMDQRADRAAVEMWNRMCDEIDDLRAQVAALEATR